MPAVAAVGGFEEDVGGEIENVWVDWRKHDRLRAVEAVFAGADNPGADILNLAGAAVEFGELAAVEDVGMERVGGNVAVFLDADGVPVAERNGAVIAAAGDADGATFLLRTVNPVGELVVGGYVVNLGGGLVVPGTPGLAAVDGDHRALVGGEQHEVGIVGIDPGGVVVVTSGGAFDGDEVFAGVGGFVGGGIAEKDRVAIFWVNADEGEVGIATGNAVFLVDDGPGFSGIVGAVDAASVVDIDGAVDAVGIRGSDGNADAAVFGGKALAELAPVVAAVFGFVEAAAGAVIAAANGPRGAAGGPEGGVDFVGVAGVKGEVDTADVVVLEKDFGESLATVEGTEYAAFWIWTVRMAQHGDEKAVGIFGINEDGADLLAVAETEMGPSGATVGGLVEAVANGEIGAAEAFAASCVEDVGIRRGDG